MRQDKLKMWVGIGSYVLSGMASTVITSQIKSATAESLDPSAPPMFIQLLAAGGEGGEKTQGETKFLAAKSAADIGMKMVVTRTKAAIVKGDFATAELELSKFEGYWKTVEEGIKAKTPQVYRAIEDSLDNVEKSVKSKNKEQALAALQVLTDSINGKAVSKAEDQGGEGGEGGESGETLVKLGAAEYGKDFTNKISAPVLLNALRKGGHIIYIRHAQTDRDYADQADPKLDLTSCSTQRTLSDKGWNQAKNIGAGFRKAKIPVGTVLASDYCRAWQTADLAFGTYKRTSALNFVKSEEYNAAQRLQMKNAVMPLLTAMPVTGTNTVIVGHDDVFDSATGIYPKPQGMAYILKPDGRGKFEILANMPAEGWMMMSK